MRVTVGYFNDSMDRNPERYVGPADEPKPAVPSPSARRLTARADFSRPFSSVEQRIIEKSKEGVHNLECKDCKNDGSDECRGGCALSAKIDRFWNTVRDPDQYNRLAELAANSFLK